MLYRPFTKPVIFSALAGFVVFSLYGFLVHGMLLQDSYNSLPAALWRSEAESQGLMHWIFIAYLLMSWMLAILRPESVTNFTGGLQYGFFAGVFLGSVNFITYAIQPLTLNITLITFLADIIMVALGLAAMAFVANRLSS